MGRSAESEAFYGWSGNWESRVCGRSFPEVAETILAGEEGWCEKMAREGRSGGGGLWSVRV